MKPEGNEPATGGSGEPIPPGETRHYTAEGTVVPSTNISQPGNLQTPGMVNVQTPGMTNAQTPGMAGVRMLGMVGPPSPTTPGLPVGRGLERMGRDDTLYFDKEGRPVGPTPYQGKPVPAGGGGLTGPVNMGATSVGGGGLSGLPNILAGAEEKKKSGGIVEGGRAPINLSVYRGWDGMPNSRKSILLAALLKEDPSGQAFIAGEANKAMVGSTPYMGPGNVVTVGQDNYIAKRMQEKTADITRRIQRTRSVANKMKLKEELEELKGFGLGG